MVDQGRLYLWRGSTILIRLYVQGFLIVFLGYYRFLDQFSLTPKSSGGNLNRLKAVMCGVIREGGVFRPDFSQDTHLSDTVPQ